jgi:uncharacterized protein (TIRG00374 family)
MKKDNPSHRLSRIKNSKLLWFGLSTLILAGLIYTADPIKFLIALTQVKTLHMLIALAFGISIFAFYGLIWHNFFKKLDINDSLKDSYKLFMGGNFLNSVTPFGNIGGEPFMAYIVSKNTESEYERCLSGVVSADIVNLIPIFTYTTIGILYIVVFSAGNQLIRNALYATILATTALLLLSFLLFSRQKWPRKRISSILNHLETVKIKPESIELLKNKLRFLKDNFEEAADDKTFLAKNAAIAHLIPLAQFLCLYFILSGLGVTPKIVAIYFTVMISGITYFSPTPGGSGAFEAAFTGLLIVFYPEISVSTSLAAAVLFRLTSYWPGLLAGYIALLDLRR